MRSYWLNLHKPAQRILYKFGLSARGKTELEILKKLSQGSTNVYKLNRKIKSDTDVHYSTVLRALRRLEKKRLVKVVSQENSGRHEKKYACTLLGQLVVALAKKGISGAVRIVAEISKSFRECIRVHSSVNYDYKSMMMELVILNLLNSKKAETVTPSELDEQVRNIELEWIKENIVRALFYDSSANDFNHGRIDNDYRISLYVPLSRSEILRYLRKIVHINWMSDYVIQFIELYIEKENEWLQALKDFKMDAKIARTRSLEEFH
jgi:DNA-binding PadR family transcriptional regulator